MCHRGLGAQLPWRPHSATYTFWSSSLWYLSQGLTFSRDREGAGRALRAGAPGGYQRGGHLCSIYPMLFCSNSDDNMLKNIELFDKLSLRFNGRVLFIKDVIGDEICCWSFYGQGRKIAEVCCTSIVYATEKKQTKVEFPEARIYEETLNILLYEAQDGRGPDNALLEATGGAAGRSHHLDEDEERERERIERVRRIHIKRPDDRAHLHQ